MVVLTDLCKIAKSMAKSMLFTRVTFRQQMVTLFPPPAIHGVSRHSSTQVSMWSKSPNDHLPLVSTTMGPTLQKCAEGWLAFVLTWSWGSAEFHYREGVEVFKKKKTPPLPQHSHKHNKEGQSIQKTAKLNST